MILGSGIDLVEIERMRRSLARSGEAFATRVFTAAERDRARADANPPRHHALLFAAKEACFKAIGLPFDLGFDWQDLDVDPGPAGRGARVVCSGKLARHLGRGRVLLAVAASRTHVMALAVKLAA